MKTLPGGPGRAGALFGAALALPALAAAQPPAPPARDTLRSAALDTVVVTARRTELRRDLVPQKIEVVTRADVERTPAAELTDVLKKTAALDVVQYAGLLSGVGIRGFQPKFFGVNQTTLVLLDGRPAGVTNLSLLSVHDVERVEVLKGPASALYGSSAMGGVLNVVTRRSAGAPRSSLHLGYGSWQTREARLSSGGALTPSLDFDLGLAWFDRGADFRVGKGNFFRDRIGADSVTRTLPDGTTARAAERGDGEARDFSEYGTLSGNLRLGYRLAERWRLDARAEGFAAERVQNPGDLYVAGYDDRTLKDVARGSGELSLRGELGAHTLRLTAFGARETAENYSSLDSVRFVSLRSPTDWMGVQLQDVLSFGAHSLTAGLDYTRTVLASERWQRGAGGVARAQPYAPDSRTTSAAVFAEGRLALLDERLIATLGGRLDRITAAVDAGEIAFLGSVAANRESYVVFNPSAGAQYRTPSGVRLHASAGRAFVTPDAFRVAGYAELRVPGSRTLTVTQGNPELTPERSVTWDAGVGFARPGAPFTADVTVFRTDVRDRVTSRFSTLAAPRVTVAGDTVRALTSYVNADDAEIRGVEWNASYDLGAALGRRFALRLFAGATHLLTAEETTQDTVTTDIRNVAGQTLNYGVEYDDGRRFSTRLSGRYVGERADLDFSSWPAAAVRYPRFMTLDLAGQLRIARRYRLGVRLENLTDENYYELRGYPLPGRNARVQVGVDF